MFYVIDRVRVSTKVFIMGAVSTSPINSSVDVSVSFFSITREVPSLSESMTEQKRGQFVRVVVPFAVELEQTNSGLWDSG